MATFTIKQTPKAKNIYLYPDNEGCHHDCIAHGAIPGWECVNDSYDFLSPEDDYVFMNESPIKHDAYTVDNPPVTASGTINYAQIVCNAKSDKFPPAWDAVFKTFIAESTVRHSTLTLRPNSDGAFSQWTAVGGGNHYEKVDEVICDNFTTYIREVTNGDKDYFGLPNHTTETGTITKVEVFMCAETHDDTVTLYSIIYDTSSTNRITHTHTWLVASGWSMQSHVFATNPDGGSWTWSDIDDLQIGVEKVSGTYPQVSQMYIEVTYEDGIECNKISTSDNQQLFTGWSKFNYNMTTNPSTSAAWVWANLNDVQIGFEASSPSVTVTPFVLLPTDDGDRTDITDVTTGYEHWEAVEKETPYAQVSEDGAAWKYDLYTFIGAGYYPAGVVRDVLPFTYNNKNYILLCSSAHGAWIYEWNGEHLKYITHHAVDSITLCVTYDGTYFYIGNTGAADTTVKAFLFNGESLTQVGEHDAGFNNPNNISINGTIENNDGYIYYVGAANNLVALSFNGVTFTQHDTIAGSGNVGLYCDGTYMHSNAHAFSFNGTSFTNICAGGNDYIWAGDGTYLYAMDEVLFSSYLVAYTFNGVAYTEVARLSVGGLGVLSDLCCDKKFIYATVNLDLKAYTFNGAAFTEEGSETFAVGKGNLISDGKFLYTTIPSSAWVHSFNGSEFATLAKLENGTTPKYLNSNIESVTVIAKMGKEYDAPNATDIRGCFNIKTHATEYNTSTDYITLEYPQRLYSHTWTTNPNTTAAWTLDEVKALQAGVGLYGTGTKYAACSRCYVVIASSAAVSPEIQVCRMYFKVNYSPDASTCSLTRPKEISYDHSRNVKMLNFWNGDREVYDLSRNNKTMVLTGMEYGTEACNRIKCVRDMGKDGSPVTISGLGFAEFNGEFRIRSFGWQKVSDRPLHYNWILELEDSEL